MIDENNRISLADPAAGSTLAPGIIVMGPYRCGTSFLCRVLSGRGVNFGPPHELYAADEWNRCGYFQRPDVLQANDDFFASADHSAFAPPDMATLRVRGNAECLRRANLDWRYGTGIWGIKDPRFCATLMSWLEAGLLGENAGLIRIHREPLASARSLLKHPELAARLGEASLEAALQVILRYEQLAEVQQRCFPGPVLSLAYEELVSEEHTGRPGRCIGAIDRFIHDLESESPVSSPPDRSAPTCRCGPPPRG